MYVCMCIGVYVVTLVASGRGLLDLALPPAVGPPAVAPPAVAPPGGFGVCACAGVSRVVVEVTAEAG